MNVVLRHSPVLSRVDLRLVARPALVWLHLDGWPLVAIDVAAGQVGVNDLGSRSMFAHQARIDALPSGALLCGPVLTVGAVGRELYVLIGQRAALFLDAEPGGIHAEARVVESCSGRLLLERQVRYRQLPAPGVGVWPGTDVVGGSV